MFQPIVLASFGVALPLQDVPPTLLIDGIDPFFIGLVTTTTSMYIRVFNDDPASRPTGTPSCNCCCRPELRVVGDAGVRLLCGQGRRRSSCKHLLNCTSRGSLGRAGDATSRLR